MQQRIRIRIRSIAALWVGAAALVLGTLTANAATPPPLEDHNCGDHINHSFRLNTDMVCPDGTAGLSIDTSGVTVDLNEKGLTGSGAADGETGILIFAESKVRITNGYIREFNEGVAGSPTGSTFDGLALIANEQGLNIGGSKHIVRNDVAQDNGNRGFNIAADSTKVERNVAIGNGTGFRVSGSTNTLTSNTASDSNNIGIEIFGAGNKLTSNSVTGNGTDGTADQNHGIVVLVSSDKTAISKNVIAANDGDGIFTQAGSTNTSIKSNLASANGLLGIEVSPGTGTGSGNIASGNGDGNECTVGFCT